MVCKRFLKEVLMGETGGGVEEAGQSREGSNTRKGTRTRTCYQRGREGALA